MAGIGQRPEKYSVSIVINQQAKTVKVGDYEPVPFLGNAEGSTVAFIAKPEIEIWGIDWHAEPHHRRGIYPHSLIRGRAVGV